MHARARALPVLPWLPWLRLSVWLYRIRLQIRKRHAKHLLKQVDGDFEGYAARCFGF